MIGHAILRVGIGVGAVHVEETKPSRMLSSWVKSGVLNQLSPSRCGGLDMDLN